MQLYVNSPLEYALQLALVSRLIFCPRDYGIKNNSISLPILSLSLSLHLLSLYRISSDINYDATSYHNHPLASPAYKDLPPPLQRPTHFHSSSALVSAFLCAFPWWLAWLNLRYLKRSVSSNAICDHKTCCVFLALPLQLVGLVSQILQSSTEN